MENGRYTVNGVNYNRNGIKVHSKKTVLSQSNDFLDKVYASKEVEESVEETMDKKAYIIGVIGKERYIRYYLHKVKGYSPVVLAKKFGVSSSAISKNSTKVMREMETLAEEIEKAKSIGDELLELEYECRLIEGETKRKGAVEADDFNFDFAESEKQYYNNMRRVEKELGLEFTY